MQVVGGLSLDQARRNQKWQQELGNLTLPYYVVFRPDRERAIRRAIEQAGPGDVVLLAGKGHETYQVLKDKVIDFDDREVARRVLRGFGYSA